MSLKKICVIIIFIGIIGFISPLNYVIFNSNEYEYFSLSNNTNDPFSIQTKILKASQTSQLLDGRTYYIHYEKGYYEYGIEYVRGIQTYLSWEGNYKPTKDRKIQYFDRSYVNEFTNQLYIKYIADCGSFKIEFTNFTNTIITSQFSFSQRPSEIGLYNWNTEEYISKENVQKAQEIIPDYQNKSLTYTEIFTNTDVKFISNESHIKEYFINDAITFWNYPGGWETNETYLVIFTELYNITGVNIYDDDGQIQESKVIKGILKLKSTELGEEIFAYLPIGKAYSKFDDQQIHSINLKNRIIFIGNKIYYVSALSYEFVKHPQRIGKLYIDPTWIIGQDGNAWNECTFFQTMENTTTHYTHLISPYFYGHITSPIGIAKLQWIRIQFNGNLHNQQVNIYWNSSNNLEDWTMELVKENAQINTNYYFQNPSRYGKWRLELYGQSNPFITPEIYNVTVFNDLPNFDDFTYYKEIEIDASKVNGSSPHLNFPLLININDSDLQTNAQNDGDDIAFANDTHWLDHEIEFWDGSISNNLVAWVRIPSLSATINTTIYMYYGNTTMGSQQNPMGVWDNNFISVYHMLDLTTSSIKDSTKNGNTGIKNSINQPLESDAFIYRGQDFSGGSDDVDLDANLGEFSDILGTFEAWLYREFPNSATAYYVFEAKYDSNNRIDLFHTTTPNWRFRHESSSGSGFISRDEDDIPRYIWTHVVMTWDVSGDSLKVYLNGSLIESDSGLYNPTNPTSILLGDRILGGQQFDGIMDEVRISNVSRSGDWIATEYNNQYNASSFYFIGEEEEIISDNDPPTWDTLTESVDPLLLGNNETIQINVYDNSSILFVYLEFGGINHTMTNISVYTYQYSQWKPNNTGVFNYSIWISDIYNNINWTGIFDITVIETIPPITPEIISTTAILAIIALFFLMGLMLYSYSQIRNFLVTLTIFVFSLIFGMSAIILFDIPFSPYFQIFFMLFQSIFLILTSLEYYNTYKRRRNY